MLVPQSFSTYTLERHVQGAAIKRILAAALQAVDPQTAVSHFVQRQGDVLFVDGQAYPLGKNGRIILIGLGKAAQAMTLPLATLLADFSLSGLIISKHAILPMTGFEIQPGGHPMPDENSLRAGEKAIRLVHDLDENDLVLCLISGGGSALMSAPQAGISLLDMRGLTAALLGCGARIDEINCLRRHLDRLKGGGLARLAFPARVVSLILSDVVDNSLETIASGPTAPDPSTRLDALAILEKYELNSRTPVEIVRALQVSPETSGADDPIFERVQNVIIGSNALVVNAVLRQAQAEGITAFSLGSEWQGEARQVAGHFCQMFGSVPYPRPFCMAAGGETTVSLRGSGKGGRNQELALAAVRVLAGMQNSLLVTFATDGEDGPTDAAGAVVSSETLQRGLDRGFSPDEFLENNDAYTYFGALSDLLKPGPTGTNVNDLTLMFGF